MKACEPRVVTEIKSDYKFGFSVLNNLLRNLLKQLVQPVEFDGMLLQFCLCH